MTDLHIQELGQTEDKNGSTPHLTADLAQNIVALWPSLPPDQRTLWFQVLDTFLPADAELLETLEDLESGWMADAAKAEGGTPIPLEQVLSKLAQASA